MELYIEHLEHGLSTFIILLRFVLEAFAALTVFWGLLRTLQYAYRMGQKKRGRRQPILSNPLEFSQIRLTLGMWLALALEFQLAADILSTTVSPSLEALASLAIIAVIRTFLNYFLSKELEAESEELKGTERHEASAPGE
jgi:uncharacterized membrane protein